MLAGAGEMAELAARHLMNNGVKKVLVANRTYERAVTLAEVFDGEAVRYEDLVGEMARADILIASTGATDYIVNHADMARVIKERKNRPVFLIDIAVPRNLDPGINKIDNVYLYDIDDLESVVESNIKERQKEAELAEDIIEEEIETFVTWMRSIDAVPTIVALREKAENIRKSELDKTLSKMDGLNDKQIKQIDGLTRSIINKVLHSPLVGLKKSAGTPDGGGHVEAIRALFELTDDSGSDEAADTEGAAETESAGS